MPPQNRLAPPTSNALAEPRQLTQEELLAYLAPPLALPMGISAGLQQNLRGSVQMVTDPIGAAKGMYEAAASVVKDPWVVLEALREARRQAFSGPYGLGKLIAENVTPGMRGIKPPVAQIAKGPLFRFPRVDEIEGINVGPSRIKPRVIAEGRPLYRETSALNANDYLRDDKNFYYGGGFVTDDPDLAIGQAANKGVMLQFRPNAVSGEMHYKPGTGVIGGSEYRADIMAPRAVEKVIVKKPKDLKNLTWLARKNLAENFVKTVNEDGSITFVRKIED